MYKNYLDNVKHPFLCEIDCGNIGELKNIAGSKKMKM